MRRSRAAPRRESKPGPAAVAAWFGPGPGPPSQGKAPKPGRGAGIPRKGPPRARRTRSGLSFVPVEANARAKQGSSQPSGTRPPAHSGDLPAIGNGRMSQAFPLPGRRATRGTDQATHKRGDHQQPTAQGIRSGASQATAAASSAPKVAPRLIQDPHGVNACSLDRPRSNRPPGRRWPSPASPFPTRSPTRQTTTQTGHPSSQPHRGQRPGEGVGR
jgi:hypothetical protein